MPHPLCPSSTPGVPLSPGLKAPLTLFTLLVVLLTIVVCVAYTCFGCFKHLSPLSYKVGAPPPGGGDAGWGYAPHLATPQHVGRLLQIEFIRGEGVGGWVRCVASLPTSSLLPVCPPPHPLLQGAWCQPVLSSRV